MAIPTAEYANTVTTRTATYLDAVADCVLLLPQILAAYDDDPARREALTTQLADRESACDDHLRSLRTDIARATPNFTDVYLRADALVELYACIDEIPNAAETFVRDLDAVSPELDPQTLATFTDVAALAARATRLLVSTTRGYVQSLTTAGPSPHVSGTVDRIAGIESQCDDRRHAVTSRAFDDLAVEDALLVRDLARSLDTVPDAVEDAADHLRFCWSGDW
ncbi:hypothetical protein [Haloarcula sp. JP-L23]|uniref:hypothetical protein n=1 Tax=Haloarcula sp. JP-L23 TaxID=2716717 RepID=UPI00140F0271|nr:hypothetical protein G9465_03570 [Haloarcula sp. JP-L23]